MLPDESMLASRPLTEVRFVRWSNWLTQHDFHRISELRGAVYTLFCTGQRLDRDPMWSFMDDETGELTGWRAFLDRKKLRARIETAVGPELDAIGLSHMVTRNPWNSNAVMDDAWYRARILAVFDGNTH